MRSRFVLVLLAVTSALLLAAPGVRAEQVLLVRPPDDDAILTEAFNRLRAELALQSYEVRVLESDAAAELQAELERGGAAAGVTLSRDATRATAVVRVPRQPVPAEQQISVDGFADAPRVLAVRTVDLLRSSLNDAAPRRETVREPPKRQPALIIRPPESHFQLRAGALALGVANDLGTAYGGTLALLYRPVSTLRVGLFVAAPLVGTRFDSRLGSAVMRQELALSRASWSLLPSRRWELGPVLGMGVYHLAAEGDVDPPLIDDSASVVSLAASAGVELGYAVTSGFMISTAFSAMLLTPRPVVAVSVESAEVASPLLNLTLDLGVSF